MVYKSGTIWRNLARNKEINIMKIDKITSEHGNDFYADMICEHCGHTAKLTTGYHDNKYHTKVIPAMLCDSCGKNRAGGTETENSEISVQTI